MILKETCLEHAKSWRNDVHVQGTWYEKLVKENIQFIFLNLSNNRKVILMNQVFTLNQVLIFFFTQSIYCSHANLPTHSFIV